MQLPVIGSIVDLRRSEREMGKGGGIVNYMEVKELCRAMLDDCCLLLVYDDDIGLEGMGGG